MHPASELHAFWQHEQCSLGKITRAEGSGGVERKHPDGSGKLITGGTNSGKANCTSPTGPPDVNSRGRKTKALH